MKSTYYIFLLFLSVNLISCRNDNHIDRKLKRISGKAVALPPEFTGMRPMTNFGDTVVLYSYSPEYNLQIGELNDSTMTVRYAIRRGNGPNELLECEASYDNSGGLYIIDSTSGRLGNMYRLSNDKLFPVGESVAQQECGYIRCTFYSFTIDSVHNVVFAGGPFVKPNSILYEADYRNGAITSLDFWPKDESRVKPEVKLGVYADKSSVYSNGKGLYVYSAFPEPYMFIFSIENGKVIPKHWIYDSKIKYSERHDGLNYKLNVSTHQIKIQANSNYIYVLHVNKDIEGQIAESYGESNYGDYVDILDWNGEILESLELDHIGTTFWVNEKKRKLYLFGFHQESFEPLIWVYKLPSL